MENHIRPEFGPEHPVLVVELAAGCWHADPLLRPAASTVAGILTKLLCSPSHLIHAYDQKYAHFLSLNRSVGHHDFDAGIYFNNPMYFSDHTTAQLRKKQNEAEGWVDILEPDTCDVSRLETSADVANQESPDLADVQVQPRSMVSLMATIGDILIKSVRSSLPKTAAVMVEPALPVVEESTVGVAENEGTPPARATSPITGVQIMSKIFARALSSRGVAVQPE